MKTPSKKSESVVEYSRENVSQLLRSIKQRADCHDAQAHISEKTYASISKILEELNPFGFVMEPSPSNRSMIRVLGKIVHDASHIPLIRNNKVPLGKVLLCLEGIAEPIKFSLEERVPPIRERTQQDYPEGTVKELFLRALIAQNIDTQAMLEMAPDTYLKMLWAIDKLDQYNDPWSSAYPPFVFIKTSSHLSEGIRVGTVISRKAQNIFNDGVSITIRRSVPSGQAILKGDTQNLRFIFDTAIFISNEGSDALQNLTTGGNVITANEWLTAESPLVAARMLAEGLWRPGPSDKQFLECTHSEFIGRKYLEIIPKVSTSFPELSYTDVIFLMYMLEADLPYPNLRAALRQFHEKPGVSLGASVLQRINSSGGLPDLKDVGVPKYLQEITQGLSDILLWYMNEAATVLRVSEEELPIPNRKDISLLKSLDKGDEAVAEELARRANGQRFIVYKDKTYKQIDIPTSCALLKQARKSPTPPAVGGQQVFRVAEVLSTVRVRFRCPVCSGGILVNGKCPICSIDYSRFTWEEQNQICVAARSHMGIIAMLREDPLRVMSQINGLPSTPSHHNAKRPELIVMEKPWQTETLLKIIGGAQ